MPEPRQTLTRDRILDAAQRILVRDGGDRLTIASVAEEARISKGGLFYHFASKQDLVEGLIERYTREFDRLLEAADDSPGSAVEAYIRSASRSDGPASRGVIAMLAAVRYAVDGLWLADTLQLAAPSRSSRAKTIELLTEMVRPYREG